MFWDVFNRLCFERGITPSSVCDKCGISRTLIRGWKDGGEPRDTTLDKLAAYLGVSAEYLKGTPDVLPIRVETVGAEEKELLRIYKLLDTKGRTLLLARAYELEEKNGQL